MLRNPAEQRHRHQSEKKRPGEKPLEACRASFHSHCIAHRTQSVVAAKQKEKRRGRQANPFHVMADHAGSRGGRADDAGGACLHSNLQLFHTGHNLSNACRDG
jgi:hypothetical protein